MTDGPPVFTPAERAFLAGQRLGRLATLAPDGSPQLRPVGFTLDAGSGVIDIGGHALERTRKFRNVQRDGRVAFVVDDLASVEPWRPRGIEVRGTAQALPASGSRPAVIRIHPRRVLGWGIDSDGLAPPSSREVSPHVPPA
ncbi:PPOX class F420-dependent oxidoreductase [Streptomyces sp. YIM 98790]|uniref:PPOX class F420-dependent oxidoreductase n=1 Tax=Streptomyces sp. YIM 98790 TaxID=2689077 RepID=UPI0014085975|nr:PPOX class F420-dependent oxidoreductase [Streptomyces sp. YIM 98790]